MSLFLLQPIEVGVSAIEAIVGVVTNNFLSSGDLDEGENTHKHLKAAAELWINSTNVSNFIYF
jgi:hypothetical protein